MLETIQYNGKAHPILPKMYAAKLWETEYGSLVQMRDVENMTMTKLLYYVYCCIANGYFYSQEAMPFTFDEMLSNIDSEEATEMIQRIEALSVKKKETTTKMTKVA